MTADREGDRHPHVARPGDAQIPQPTGPQPGGGPPLAELPRPPRVAAGRDIRRATRREPQVGQATSASSDLRRIRVSKSASQAGQAYSKIGMAGGSPAVRKGFKGLEPGVESPRMVTAALAALLLTAAGSPSSASVRPTLHGSVGTGYCDRATVPGTETTSPNPCYLVFGAQASLRYRLLEAGVSYEGREILDLLSLFGFRPPTATVLGGSLGLTSAAWERWRLSVAGEAGWRRYTHFAGHGPDAWRGDADTVYAGVVARAATGLNNPGGRTDRIEVTVAWRNDLRTATDEEYGQVWVVGGWSITMGIGLVLDW